MFPRPNKVENWIQFCNFHPTFEIHVRHTQADFYHLSFQFSFFLSSKLPIIALQVRGCKKVKLFFSIFSTNYSALCSCWRPQLSLAWFWIFLKFYTNLCNTRNSCLLLSLKQRKKLVRISVRAAKVIKQIQDKRKTHQFLSFRWFDSLISFFFQRNFCGGAHRNRGRNVFYFFVLQCSPTTKL